MIILFLHFLEMCSLLLRESERAHTRLHEQGRQRVGARVGETIPRRLCAVSAEPDIGLDPTDRDGMSCASQAPFFLLFTSFLQGMYILL